jgi:hypothetical protein
VPLFVNLTVAVYNPNSPILNQKDLLERYIERQLSFDQRGRDRRKELEGRDWAYKTVEAEPKLQETSSSLSWIARQLQANTTVDLLIERMQPSWIESARLRWCYQLIMLLIVFLVIELHLGLVRVIGGGNTLEPDLIVGLVVGIFSMQSEIDPVEGFQISLSRVARQKVLKQCRYWLIVGLIGGLIYGLIYGHIYVLIRKLDNLLIHGLIVGLIVGLMLGSILGLISGLKQELKVRSYPNQGIWNSLQSMLWITAFSYPLGVIGTMIASSSGRMARLGGVEATTHEWINMFSICFPCSVKVGLLIVLVFGFIFGGGLACVQHLCLRFILWRSGVIPWNFPRFLNYCVERRLLLRVGGRYRFLHRELLDHFAQSNH